MQEYNKNLKFIYEKPKKYNLLIITYICLMIIFLIYALSIKKYSKFETKAILINNEIIIPTVLENVNLIEKSEYFKLDSNKYTFKIKEYGKIYNNKEINLQDLTISSNIDKKLENQIFNITFYYDNELIIKKIVEGVLE